MSKASDEFEAHMDEHHPGWDRSTPPPDLLAEALKRARLAIWKDEAAK